MKMKSQKEMIVAVSPLENDIILKIFINCILVFHFRMTDWITQLKLLELISYKFNFINRKLNKY